MVHDIFGFFLEYHIAQTLCIPCMCAQMAQMVNGRPCLAVGVWLVLKQKMHCASHQWHCVEMCELSMQVEFASMCTTVTEMSQQKYTYIFYKQKAT